MANYGKRKPALPRPCIHCGTEFTPCPRRKAARFCSRKCSGTGMAQVIGDAQRGRGAGLAYIKRGGRHEHRIVAEQKLGRPLRPGEVVHHIDGNHRNNAPENLEVITQGAHMRRHGLGIPGMELPWQPWAYRRSA